MQPDSTNSKPDYSFLSAKPVNQGPSKKKRIMIVAGGGIVLLLVIILGISLIFGGSSGDSPERTLKLAQLHTELIRVSELGKKSARGQAAKNLATTTHVTLLSDEAIIVGLAEKDQKIPSKLLRAGQDAKTDEALTEAEQRTQFDQVFIPLLIDEIKEYQKELAAAYDASNSKSSRDIYNRVHTNLTRIIDAAEKAN